MQPDEPVAEPDWVAALLNQTGGSSEPDTSPGAADPPLGVPTVRAEFVRRVGRADLGDDEGAVRRIGLAALDRRLWGQ